MQSQTETSPITYAACPNCRRLNKISLAKAKSTQPTCGACKTAIDIHGAIVTADARMLQKLAAGSPLPVIVDFWAPWCGPCRAFAPTFEKVANEFAGRAVFVKLNTQDDPTSSQVYGIRGIPMMAVFQNGKELAREGGAQPYDVFRAWVSRFA